MPSSTMTFPASSTVTWSMRAYVCGHPALPVGDLLLALSALLVADLQLAKLVADLVEHGPHLVGDVLPVRAQAPFDCLEG